MSRLKKTLGENFADRMDERRGLNRVRVAGRNEDAVSGPIATRALEALGARAMTLDDSIILPENFDAADPEQAALYAHEAYHVNEGAGMEASHHIHDAEESAARAVEQMVFHEMSAGMDLDAGAVIHRAVDGSSGSDSGAGVRGPEGGKDQGMETAEGVYKALLSQGQTHDDIVEMLAQSVLQSMDEQREEGMRNPLDDAGSYNF